MKKFLLVTTILSVGINPLATGAFLNYAYAQKTEQNKVIDKMTEEEKKELLEKKLAAIQERVEAMLALIEDPEQRAAAQSAYDTTQKIQSPLKRAQTLVKLRKVLSIKNPEKRQKLMAKYTAYASKAVSHKNDRKPWEQPYPTEPNNNEKTTSTANKDVENTSTDTTTPEDLDIEEVIVDDETFSFDDEDFDSDDESEDATKEAESTKTTKDAIYQNLLAQYQKPECNTMTTTQLTKLKAINDFSKTAKFKNEEALLKDYETKIKAFFTDDFVPNNCKKTDAATQQQSASGSSGGGGGGMCQLMQLLKSLIPAAAVALAGGGTLGDANSIGQQELKALQQNKSMDQNQDQKTEREKQMAAVTQGLAAIAKMMMGGQQQGQQQGQQGQQSAQGCK